MSPFVYIMPVLVVGLLVYQFVMRKRGMAATKHATLAALAQRLGMVVIKGDPKLNLHYFDQPARDFKRTLSLHGTPYGRQLTFELNDGADTKEGLLGSTRTTVWGCYLVAHPTVAVPDFEIVHRHPTNYLEPSIVHENLPEVGLGRPDLDARYRVATADPRIAAALASVAALFEGHTYFHIVAHGGLVMLPLTRYGMPCFVHAAEDMLYMLEAVVCAMEGRVAPEKRAMVAQAGAAPSPAIQRY